MARTPLKIKQPKVIHTIAPEEILECFLVTKLVPTQRIDYFKRYKGKIKADSLGALYAHSAMRVGRKLDEVVDYVLDNSIPISSELIKFNGMDSEYITGFVSGFDGSDLIDLRPKEYNLGYEHGRSAWRLVSKYV